MAKEPKSTMTLSYSFKGDFDLGDMKIRELLDADSGEEVVHDLNDFLSQFDGKEVTLSISMKDKLEGE